MKWQDSLNLAGSIASITGVSLVWFKTLAPNIETSNLVLGLFASAIGALLTIGVIALTFEALQDGAHRLVTAESRFGHIIYWSFAVAAALFIDGMLLFFVWAVVYIAWIIK